MADTVSVCPPGPVIEVSIHGMPCPGHGARFCDALAAFPGVSIIIHYIR